MRFALQIASKKATFLDSAGRPISMDGCHSVNTANTRLTSQVGIMRAVGGFTLNTPFIKRHTRGCCPTGTVLSGSRMLEMADLCTRVRSYVVPGCSKWQTCVPLWFAKRTHDLQGTEDIPGAYSQIWKLSSVAGWNTSGSITSRWIDTASGYSLSSCPPEWKRWLLGG